ncbi:DUF427 domain-containing protein [Rhodococcus zopfii]|uniref:DUF427 domain-containing protein n=1 Tax=Rhodococcus zopfii TaxID=43772 RepID=UPI0011110EAB|nr:DUF427 domain-containing protein [Rhodococcus zopfii]
MAARKPAIARPGQPTDVYRFEPSARRVRGSWFGRTVVDSTGALLVWPPGLPVPFYAFPVGDVNDELLTPAMSSVCRRPDVRQWFDVVVGDRRAPAVAFAPDVEGLDDRIAFEWFRRTQPGEELPGAEHWFEEDTEVFVHPRDPYSRVDALPSSRHVTVAIGGSVVADTHAPVLLFETGLPVRYYIPANDVDFAQLEESELHTACPYKGVARYWSFTGTPRVENVAWSYPEPIVAVAAIAGHVAFYGEATDITVDPA